MNQSIDPLEYIDYPPVEQIVICWAFDLAALATSAETEDRTVSQMVGSAIVEAMHFLANCNNKKFRDRSFTVWWGDLRFLIVGVPDNTPDIVVIQLNRFLCELPGLIEQSTADTVRDGLVPKFRYEAGRIVVYECEDRAGTAIVDGPNGYGTCATLHFRMLGPEWLMRGQRYQERDSVLPEGERQKLPPPSPSPWPRPAQGVLDL